MTVEVTYLNMDQATRTRRVDIPDDWWLKPEGFIQASLARSLGGIHKLISMKPARQNGEAVEVRIFGADSSDLRMLGAEGRVLFRDMMEKLDRIEQRVERLKDLTPDRSLNIHEAAAFLGIPRGRMYILVKSGLPVCKDGKSFSFILKDLIDFRERYLKIVTR